MAQPINSVQTLQTHIETVKQETWWRKFKIARSLDQFAEDLGKVEQDVNQLQEQPLQELKTSLENAKSSINELLRYKNIREGHYSTFGLFIRNLFSGKDTIYVQKEKRDRLELDGLIQQCADKLPRPLSQPPADQAFFRERVSEKQAVKELALVKKHFPEETCYRLIASERSGMVWRMAKLFRSKEGKLHCLIAGKNVVAETLLGFKQQIEKQTKAKSVATVLDRAKVQDKVTREDEQKRAEIVHKLAPFQTWYSDDMKSGLQEGMASYRIDKNNKLELVDKDGKITEVSLDIQTKPGRVVFSYQGKRVEKAFKNPKQEIADAVSFLDLYREVRSPGDWQKSSEAIKAIKDEVAANVAPTYFDTCVRGLGEHARGAFVAEDFGTGVRVRLWNGHDDFDEKQALFTSEGRLQTEDKRSYSSLSAYFEAIGAKIPHQDVKTMYDKRLQLAKELERLGEYTTEIHEAGGGEEDIPLQLNIPGFWRIDSEQREEEKGVLEAVWDWATGNVPSLKEYSIKWYFQPCGIADFPLNFVYEEGEWKVKTEGHDVGLQGNVTLDKFIGGLRKKYQQHSIEKIQPLYKQYKDFVDKETVIPNKYYDPVADKNLRQVAQSFQRSIGIIQYNKWTEPEIWYFFRNNPKRIHLPLRVDMSGDTPKFYLGDKRFLSVEELAKDQNILFYVDQREDIEKFQIGDKTCFIGSLDENLSEGAFIARDQLVCVYKLEDEYHVAWYDGKYHNPRFDIDTCTVAREKLGDSVQKVLRNIETRASDWKGDSERFKVGDKRYFIGTRAQQLAEAEYSGDVAVYKYNGQYFVAWKDVHGFHNEQFDPDMCKIGKKHMGDSVEEVLQTIDQLKTSQYPGLYGYF